MRTEAHFDDGTRIVVDATPDCGQDFCDICGDCLHCYFGEHCGPCRWVIYEGASCEVTFYESEDRWLYF